MRQLYSPEGYQRERGLVPLRKRRSDTLRPFHEDQLPRMKVHLALQAEQSLMLIVDTSERLKRRGRYRQS